MTPDQSGLLSFNRAFEIPLHAQLLAKSGRYAAIVAAGLVVDGGMRHEFVAASVIDALMKVQLDNEVPVISVVLTPKHFHGHDEHQSFFSQHFITKATEAALACTATISNIRKLDENARSANVEGKLLLREYARGIRGQYKEPWLNVTAETHGVLRTRMVHVGHENPIYWRATGIRGF